MDAFPWYGLDWVCGVDLYIRFPLPISVLTTTRSKQLTKEEIKDQIANHF